MKANAHVLLGLVSVIALFVGCQSVRKVEPLQGTPQQRATQFVEKGWAFPIGNTVAEIKKNLGKPVSEEIEEAHFSSQAASAYAALGIRAAQIHHLRYNGLIVDVYRQPSEKIEFVSKIVISDPRYPMRWGLHVDASSEEVLRVLGKAALQTVEKLEYESESSTASFILSHGRVAQVQWVPNVD